MVSVLQCVFLAILQVTHARCSQITTHIPDDDTDDDVAADVLIPSLAGVPAPPSAPAATADLPLL